jgi:transposase-like protein
MKRLNGFRRPRRPRTSINQRTQLLAAFDRSGLSAAAFARQHGIGCSTFYGWRHRQGKSPPSPAFVEVELSGSAAAVELLIELGAQARLRLNSPAQVDLAARLLHCFNVLVAC